MNNIIYSFILTTLAGLSTILGFFIIFIKGDKKKIISISLSFASGVMLIISIIDLIPSSINYLYEFNIIFKILLTILGIIVGITLSNIFDHYINYENNALYQVGILTLLGIIIHNIPEGIITFLVCNTNREVGLSLAISIGLHNIPEGISISIPLFYASNNKKKTFLLVLIAGCSELVGGIITYFFLRPLINNLVMGLMFSIIAGIMLNISIFSLYRESIRYNIKYSLIGFILGIITMLISHFLL